MKTRSFRIFSSPFPVLAVSVLLLSGGCDSLKEYTASSAPSAAPPPAAAAPATPPPAQVYDQAVLSAATALLANAKLPPAGTPAQAKYAVVIDPLIDGMTGAQSVQTKSMGVRLTALMREHYPQFDVKPFSAVNVAKSPLVLIGTFTGVNAERKTVGTREAYRICLALADLRSGKLVSKGLAFALPDGVDPTPLPFFRDAPAWSDDPATEGYIKTCQGTKAGDPINPLYLDRILAASLVAEAIDAYDAGRYQDALELYNSALATPAGDQFRVHNGIYLSHWKLGRTQQATAAFGKIVDYGLERRRLAVKFLFRPGSTAFVQDTKLSGPLPAMVEDHRSTHRRQQQLPGNHRAHQPDRPRASERTLVAAAGRIDQDEPVGPIATARQTDDRQRGRLAANPGRHRSRRRQRCTGSSGGVQGYRLLAGFAKTTSVKRPGHSPKPDEPEPQRVT